MKLQEYMAENCVNIRLFAKKVGISVATIYGIFNGCDVLLSTALKIEDITKKKVTCRDMIPITNHRDRARKRKEEKEKENKK
ncbi:MAG TPA: hypothetical protein VKZ95_01330 [Sphingobacteriaceae bacterium]|nr:hypothetical protein [Sphingobacteriaceae bacterium]